MDYSFDTKCFSQMCANGLVHEKLRVLKAQFSDV